MEELKIVYNVITDIWKLVKKYNCERLNNIQSEEFLKDSNALVEKYKAYGPEIDALVRRFIVSVEYYYESKEKNGEKN